MEPEQILSVRRGTVVAPAGCGKTEMIASVLAAHVDRKPILVLTHTNAGVASLRERLNRRGISGRQYRLATLDGWALRLISTFPVRAEYDDGPAPVRPNYREIRTKAYTLLQRRHVSDILAASYSRVLVDEYQDCSVNQHAVVGYLSNTLPTVLFGDPLQAIFGFSDDPLPNWEDVLKHFPLLGELDRPWRWINVGQEAYGNWLLQLRSVLAEGGKVDLDSAPANIQTVILAGDAGDHGRLVEAARCRKRTREQKVLVIGDSRSAESRHRIARSVPGIVSIEPVQLGDLVTFARSFDIASDSAIERLLDFAATVATNVGAKELLARTQSLRSGTARVNANDVESAALRFLERRSWKCAAELLSIATSQAGSRIFRPTVLRSCIRAFTVCAASPEISLVDAVVQIREQFRAHGRQLPSTAIGSTLLLKGLESDHVVVLNAGELDVQNLYVALTRGAVSATICARTRTLEPAR